MKFNQEPPLPNLNQFAELTERWTQQEEDELLTKVQEKEAELVPKSKRNKSSISSALATSAALMMLSVGCAGKLNQAGKDTGGGYARESGASSVKEAGEKFVGKLFKAMDDRNKELWAANEERVIREKTTETHINIDANADFDNPKESHVGASHSHSHSKKGKH